MQISVNESLKFYKWSIISTQKHSVFIASDAHTVHIYHPVTDV